MNTKQAVIIITMLTHTISLIPQDQTTLCSKQCYSLQGKKYTPSQLVLSHPVNPSTGIKTINAHTKSNVPAGVSKGFQTTFCSFTKSAKIDINHPPANQLFPDDASLSQLLESFLTSIKQDTYFTVYFSKIHLLYLHELYIYLTKIYTVFNLTPYASLDKYLDQETKTGFIRKKLIINHLISIIEAQSNQAVLARFPAGLPKHLATYAGNVLMKNDYGANLDMLLKDSEKTIMEDPSTQKLLNPNLLKSTFESKRDLYFTLLGNYLKFFNHYTATLSQKNTAQEFTGFSTFVAHAQRIQTIMDKIMTDAATTLKSAQQITPPLFFYDTPSIRALKVIPQLAHALPLNTISIEWPKALVDAAQTGSTLKDKFRYESTIPLAYFTDSKGKKVTSPKSAKHLYVNIPTMQYLYVQEVLPQPAWLNSADGVIKMLRACVGDFSILFDPVFKDQSIIDPCLGCIIANAAQKAGLSPVDVRYCQATAAYLKGIEAALNAVQMSSQVGDGGDSGDSTGSIDPNAPDSGSLGNP